MVAYRGYQLDLLGQLIIQVGSLDRVFRGWFRAGISLGIWRSRVFRPEV